ncbi:MAG: hypothetical protein ABFQ64_10360 [Campylobacterota bacterium]
MPHSDEKYKIEEKEVDGVLKFHVKLGEEIKVFETLLEAKLAIKTFKLGEEFHKHAGMELFIQKD